MRKFWKRRLKASDIEIVVTRMGDDNEMIVGTADYLLEAEQSSGKPALFFAGGLAYDVSFRRRTK